jgi:hypothetical protein
VVLPGGIQTTIGLYSTLDSGPSRLLTSCRARDRLPAKYVKSRVRDTLNPEPCACSRPSCSAMSNTDSQAQGFADRVQSFVTENRRAILIGAALAVAAGGVAFYASASSSPSVSGDRRDRKKKFVKPKPHDPESGPIIEEIPVEDQPSMSWPFNHWTPGLVEVDFPPVSL